MKTGNVVQKFWLYESDCCQLEALFDSGDVFSRCPRCSSLCDWEMADLTSEEMRALKATSKLENPRERTSYWKELNLRHSY